MDLLAHRNRQLILRVFVSISILIISGFITRLLLARLGVWFASWSAAGGLYAILAAVLGILSIPLIFVVACMLLGLAILSIKLVWPLSYVKGLVPYVGYFVSFIFIIRGVGDFR